MRQHLSRPRAFALFMMVLLLSILAPEYRAAEATQGDDTPLQVKIVEIKGTKVRLPIPDGYEEMKREDHPERYDWMVNATSDEGMLPLMFLINSEDKAQMKQKSDRNFRYGFAYADSDSWEAIIRDDSIKKDRKYFKKYIRDLAEGINELLKEKNEIEMDYSYLFDGRKSISAYHIKKSQYPDEDYKRSFTESYIILDKKVTVYTLYKNIYNDEDIYLIKKTTVDFLKKIDQGSY